MRATFALFLASGLILGGATLGPSARAVSTGHGGDVPNPVATTPSAPGTGAYRGDIGAAPSTPSAPGMAANISYGDTGYGTASPSAAPGMGASNGYAGPSGYNGAAPPTPAVPGTGASTGYGTNGPGQAPAPGGPATGMPPQSPAPGAPLAVSRTQQPRRGTPVGPDYVDNRCASPGAATESEQTPVDCGQQAAGTDFSFTSEAGMIWITVPNDSLSCPPGAGEQEFLVGSDADCQLGNVTVVDGRGGNAEGNWTAYAGTSDFTWSQGTGGAAGDTIPYSDVSYDPRAIDTMPYGGTANGNTVVFGGFPSACPVTGQYPTGCMVPVVTAAGVPTARWDPVVFIHIPPDAHLTAPGQAGTEYYFGTIYHSVV